MKLGDGSVILVGSRLGKYFHQRAAVSSFLGRERIRRDADLLDGVGLGSEIGDAVARVAVDAGAVDVVLVLLLPLSGGIDLVSGLGLEAVRTEGGAAAEQLAAPGAA